MGLLPSVFRSATKYGPDSDYWYRGISMPTQAGVNVDEKTAVKYLTVLGCITLISGDVAKLPLNLYRRRKDGGKDSITDHPLFDLLHNAPNDEMAAYNYREAAQGHILLWGNTFSYIERDGFNKIRGLWLIDDPGGVSMYREGGKILYTYEVNGKKIVRPKEEVFHVAAYGFNGLYGLSMIAQARESIGVGLAAEKYGGRFFGEGTHPSGLLTLPPEVQLGDQKEEYLKALKEQYSGLGKSHTIMLLQNGEQYKPINMSMEDAQFLQTRDHQKIEICGMYHVPPHKIAIHGQNSNYNNLEQENASYVDSCLMHHLKRWEDSINHQLLTESERKSGLFFEFLVAGLLRGDSDARASFYNKLFQVGAMTPNEIRAKENLNPISVDGGDDPFVMLNMIPLKAATDMEKIESGGTNVGNLEKITEKPPEEEAKSFFKRLFSKDKAIQRSITTRDRIAKRYAPLIKDAAQAIVNREANAIKRKIASRSAENDIISDFLDEFYKNFPEYIENKMGKVLRAFMLAIADEAYSEAGLEDISIDVEIKDYIERFAERYIESSVNQMNVLLESDDLAELENRADEWVEKRADKVVMNETVRASGAAYVFVGAVAGLICVWRTRGAKTCPFCKQFEGVRVKSGEAFVAEGGEIDPGGGLKPMKSYGMKTHPPLHQGCDCYISFE